MVMRQDARRAAAAIFGCYNNVFMYKTGLLLTVFMYKV